MSSRTKNLDAPNHEGPQSGPRKVNDRVPSLRSQPPTRLLYRAEEAAAMLSISRSRVFELLRSSQLRSVTQGRTRLISHTALVEFVEELEGRHR